MEKGDAANHATSGQAFAESSKLEISAKVVIVIFGLFSKDGQVSSG